jgi:hypothetical protein
VGVGERGESGVSRPVEIGGLVAVAFIEEMMSVDVSPVKGVIGV